MIDLTWNRPTTPPPPLNRVGSWRLRKHSATNPPPPTESRRLLEITEKTQEIQQAQLGSSAAAILWYASTRQGRVHRFCSARHVTASVISTRKFQKISAVFPEIYINSVTLERQSIQRLSLRSNGIHFRIQRITLLLDIDLKPQETA